MSPTLTYVCDAPQVFSPLFLLGPGRHPVAYLPRTAVSRQVPDLRLSASCLLFCKVTLIVPFSRTATGLIQRLGSPNPHSPFVNPALRGLVRVLSTDWATQGIRKYQVGGKMRDHEGWRVYECRPVFRIHRFLGPCGRAEAQSYVDRYSKCRLSGTLVGGFALAPRIRPAGAIGREHAGATTTCPDGPSACVAISLTFLRTFQKSDLAIVLFRLHNRKHQLMSRGCFVLDSTQNDVSAICSRAVRGRGRRDRSIRGGCQADSHGQRAGRIPGSVQVLFETGTEALYTSTLCPICI